MGGDDWVFIIPELGPVLWGCQNWRCVHGKNAFCGCFFLTIVITAGIIVIMVMIMTNY